MRSLSDTFVGIAPSRGNRFRQIVLESLCWARKYDIRFNRQHFQIEALLASILKGR